VFKIAVVDGQGGGIGSLIVKRLRDEFGDDIEILALGTNAAATSAMMKSRSNKGATGENAIVWNAGRVNMIIGPLSVVLINAMLGELTQKMVEAIISSDAKKVLLPLNQERIDVVGVVKEPLPHMIEKTVEIVRQQIRKENENV
jgi:NAD(P)-dependent dehydrogenase (short-subunit alcohol dehydrogenase family)